MYGKHFASMYEGSMMGAGPIVFAVWGYVISKAVSGQVELNPKLIAILIGCEPFEVEGAIEYLCRPDPKSRTDTEDGRRLIKEGQFAYRVVTHEIYSRMRTNDDRREYNRKKQAEYRATKKTACVPVNVHCVQSVQKCTESTHEDEDANEDTKKKDKKRSTFQKPSITDVEQYAHSASITIDAAAFVDYYESKGWLIGKSPMKDWKATVRNWVRRSATKEEPKVSRVFDPKILDTNPYALAEYGYGPPKKELD